MSFNFSNPFGLNSQGQINITSDPNEIAQTRIQSLIGTYPGERVMQPTYGVDLPSYLFTPDIIEDTDLIANDIQQAVATWEPSLNVIEITPVVIQADVGISDINVEFSISNDPTITPAQTATILVGGTVVNN